MTYLSPIFNLNGEKMLSTKKTGSGQYNYRSKQGLESSYEKYVGLMKFTEEKEI